MRLETEKKSSAGFSLIELMIAMAIAGIMIAAIYGVFEAQVRGQVSQGVSLQMTQGLRAALEIMASDIRMAGCDPTASGNASIMQATATQLRMTMDTGGGPNNEPNGTIEPNEDVWYRINTSGNLGREVGGAGNAQPIALHCDALNFVYLNADGIPFVPVTAADRSDIRAVEVSIVVRSADTKNPGFLRSYTDNTSYKNLQGVEIFKAPGDNFRRFQLSEAIACRN